MKEGWKGPDNLQEHLSQPRTASFWISCCLRNTNPYLVHCGQLFMIPAQTQLSLIERKLLSLRNLHFSLQDWLLLRSSSYFSFYFGCQEPQSQIWWYFINCSHVSPMAGVYYISSQSQPFILKCVQTDSEFLFFYDFLLYCEYFLYITVNLWGMKQGIQEKNIGVYV